MVNHSLSLQHTLVLVCFPLFLTHVFNMLIIALLMPTLDMIKLSWTVLILTYNYVDSPPQRVLFPPFCIYSSYNWYFNMVPLPLQDSIGYGWNILSLNDPQNVLLSPFCSCTHFLSSLFLCHHKFILASASHLGLA